MERKENPTAPRQTPPSRPTPPPPPPQRERGSEQQKGVPRPPKRS
ncbi:hypothetical protein [Flavobacterium azizsancarii]|nr:hypothetical protein [Flavobacterium azizsancarii]